MQHTVALETGLVFLLATFGAWWAGASTAYMVAMLFSITALFCTIGKASQGAAAYAWLLAVALLVAGYLRDHPPQRG